GAPQPAAARWTTWASLLGGAIVTSSYSPAAIVQACASGATFSTQLVRALATADRISDSEFLARVSGHAPRQLAELATRIAQRFGCSSQIVHAVLTGESEALEQYLARNFPETLLELKRFTDLPPLLIANGQCDDSEWLSSALAGSVAMVRCA